jgi:two-component system KDP operon response regulator KdpE
VTKALFCALVVEDDAGIRDVLRTLLEAEGFRVVLAGDAGRGLIEARAHRPDVLLVDLGLPDRDGQQLIRDVRAFSGVPILVLSARTAEAEKITALENGADDYVTKPFGAGELLARVRAALRRSVRTVEQDETLRIGTLTLDLARREARAADGTSVHFTPIEFRILARLARDRGLVVRQDELIRDVWGPAHDIADTRGLRAFVKALRQKIEPDPRRPVHLVTEIGVGYRLIGD